MEAAIRIATRQDAKGILAIYAPIIRETAISFEIDPPSTQSMEQRVTSTLERYPWLVCNHDGDILGYVYASKHRERAAYQWSVDVSVYIQAGRRRTGLGRALYTSLFALLKRQGYFRCFAGITLPNEASVALHESLGFTPVGIFRDAGYKHEAWYDVGWWQYGLRELEPSPKTPIPFKTLVQSESEWQHDLALGQAHLSL